MKKHIFISGRVQGVGFRHFTRKNAERLGITGWVKNLPDGRVEAVLEGEEQAVTKMIKKCWQGPATSYVKDIKESEIRDEQTFDDFSVLL